MHRRLKCWTRLPICILLSTLMTSAMASEKIVRMAYKDEEKPPLIGPPGDNSGIYIDMFSKAAEDIGYRLEISRLPKKRLYITLEKGDLDFYPGSSFSEERSEYLVFLANGLQTKEVVISRNPHEEINKLDDMSGKLLIDLGGSKTNINDKYPKLSTYPVPSLEFEQSLTLLRLGRVDYYIADIEEVLHYADKMSLKGYEEIDLKIHHNALGGMQPMYMGFSMNSPLFAKRKNPLYDPTKPLSYTNTPFTASKDSVAYRLHEALITMQKNGELDDILKRYK